MIRITPQPLPTGTNDVFVVTAAVRDWLALVIFPAVMFAFSAAALVTCIRWWIEA